MKVCLVSSTGGHLIELKKIMPAIQQYEFFFVTEQSEMSNELKNEFKVYYLVQQERKNIHIIKNLLVNIFKSINVLIKEGPDVIISTGAGAVFPLCLFGKMLGKKIIYIESFAKVNSPSLTGKLVYKFADEFYIQWESLKSFYPKAKYRGSLY
ncbi:PssD/Cps14F family polysaccharide biosynthesis glycosyltransferase [Priestia megaterium]|uniref:PssD/Cps14F family polysaccharide biosynthesis glycosyltransferase n=1 Tax=Priestia megaterium TaxID=1404 RepID=UPI000BEDC0B9|nr:PssD/Cps14F family polysaccharide biosynthesis glycosyltransferase [Priestia megaterium]MBE2975904.1 polysaccharide biosynthesis protein [Priestia megaterium]PEB65257.1 polysaccharide biosynthesis protein [Priestia megaterium]